MNSLYNHAIKQSQVLQKDLERFEDNYKSAPLSLQGSISTTLINFNKTIDEYETLSRDETNDDKKLKANVRVEKFREELTQARNTFNRLKKEREEANQELSRTELLGRRTHNTSTPDNPYARDLNGPDQPEQESRYSNLSQQEGLFKERNILQKGNEQLDHFISQANFALEELYEQNTFLQNAHTKMVGTLNTLGVSNSTIRTIERRAKQDKLIFWGGCLFTLVSFYYILKWFR